MLSKIRAFLKPKTKIYRYEQPYGGDGRPSPGFSVRVESDKDHVSVRLWDQEARCTYNIEWDPRTSQPVSVSRTF